MSAYYVWWLIAAVLIGAELVTGTFYLLVIAIAFAVGGLAAWLGLGTAAQILSVALIGAGGTIAVWYWKKAHPAEQFSQNLDIGQSVRVDVWHPDGTARVTYRGAQWNAELASRDTPQLDNMVIQAMRGSVLILSDKHK